MGGEFLILFGGGQQLAFSPDKVAGLKLWADFSDITTLFQNSARSTPVTADGQIIGGVTDKSGAGNHLIQAGADTLKPLYKTAIQNGRSVALFDGVNDWIRATFTLAQPYTVYMVLSQISWTLNERLWDGVAGQSMLFQPTATPRIAIQAGGAAVFSDSLALNTFALVRAYYSGVNSALSLNNGAQIVGTIGTTSAGGITIGGSTAGVWNGNMYCGEVYIFNRQLSDSEDAQMRGFINKKWALYP